MRSLLVKAYKKALAGEAKAKARKDTSLKILIDMLSPNMKELNIFALIFDQRMNTEYRWPVQNLPSHSE